MLLGNVTEKNKTAYSVAEVAEMTSLSKSFLRNEIRAKNLRAKAVGRRVLILDIHLREYLSGQKDKDYE